MCFSYLEIFLVAILPLEAKTYNCLTFHNLYQEGCLCQTITSKQIKLAIFTWSGFEGLEKFFPTIMWFFYLKFFWLRYGLHQQQGPNPLTLTTTIKFKNEKAFFFKIFPTEFFQIWKACFPEGLRTSLTQWQC